MKYYFSAIFIILLNLVPVYSNGVCIIDASKGEYLRLDNSEISVIAENQISIITVTQTFKNIGIDSAKFSFAFPIPTDANATSLQWNIDTNFYAAKVSDSPPDSTLPGTDPGNINSSLKTFLGESPLLFAIPQKLGADKSITITLTYVQFLKYDFGIVNFIYPNNYSLIQKSIIVKQSCSFLLKSQKKIENIALLSHEGAIITKDDFEALLTYSKFESIADKDYEINYMLNSDELGLFGFSTYQDSVPDEYGRGYFMFVAEPDQSENTKTISKIFTLILDHSGSMSGTKIEQAKQAAKFIVENLNEGDQFNIVAFNSANTIFRENHVPFNLQNQLDALEFINTFVADGSTDIGGAFNVSLLQFPPPNNESVNIILFFTDGQPTAGITKTTELINYINGLNSEKGVIIFPFGIGNDVDKKLLAQIALDNNGIVDFLDNNELLKKITTFYLKIRNPVLLNSAVSYEPNVVEETYPAMLPNLYKGQQMMVSGRYNEPVNLKIKLSGNAFGKELVYEYILPLASEEIESLSFLPKIWAKMKIEDLLIKYYLLPSNSIQADSLKALITKISVSYGIITKFTSFTQDDDWDPTKSEEFTSSNDNINVHISPNPMIDECNIDIHFKTKISGAYLLKIYNLTGELVALIPIILNNQDSLQLKWNGKDFKGNDIPSGYYHGILELNNTILSIKINKI